LTIVLLTYFWLALAFISILMFSSNFLLAALLSSIKRGSRLAPCRIGCISIIIPAYNEECNIVAKIDSLWLALQGIQIDTEVLIGSDGSRDRTVEIAESRLKELNADSWKVVKFENEGKCNTLNKLVRMTRGELIISTDADVAVPENAVKLIVAAFEANSRLGCLSCIPVLTSSSVGSQKHYWNIEDRIRNAESLLGKLIVVTGWLYAYRRDAYEEIPRGVMADDLWIPLTYLLKGYDCEQLEGLEVASEATDEEMEIKRRKRVISGGMDVVRRLFLRLLKSPGLLFLVIAHKVNRWALPLWLGVFTLATIGIWPYAFFVYIFMTVVVYIKFGKKRFMSLVYAVFSPFLSFAEVMSKSDFARWEHTRK